jgi:hypothetical protein
MVIHDDADMAEVVRESVAALKESARHVGKADRHISDSQIAEIEAAMDVLKKTLELKKRVNDTGRSL